MITRMSIAKLKPRGCFLQIVRPPTRRCFTQVQWLGILACFILTFCGVAAASLSPDASSIPSFLPAEYAPSYSSHNDLPSQGPDLTTFTAPSPSSLQQHVGTSTTSPASTTEITRTEAYNNVILSRRRLSASVTNQPIPTQIADVNVPYQLPLANIFTGNFTMLSANLQGGAPLPDWLQLNYKRVGSIASDIFTAVLANDILLASCYTDCALAFYDVSHISSPQLVGRFGNRTDFFWAIQVKGTNVFAASSNNGLLIIDIADVRHPRLVGSSPLNCNSSCQISIAGTTAYLVGSQFGLQLIDITNSSHPIFLGSLSSVPTPTDVTISGHVAYVATQLDGLYLIDVTDQNHPQILSVFRTDFMLFTGVTISGTTAFVPNYSEGLLLVDVTNSSDPQLLSTFYTGSGAAQQVGVAGSTAFLSNLLAAVQLVDISDLRNPQLLGSLTDSDITKTIIRDNLILEVNSNGIQIIDTSQGIIAGTPPLDFVNRQLEIEVHARDNGISLSTVSFSFILDQPPYVIISTLLDQSVFPAASLSFNINSKLLFNNPSSSLLSPSLQLSNGQPAPSWATISMTPAPISSFPPGSGSTQRLVISGSMAFIANGDAGLQIIDLTDIRNPHLLSTYSVAPASIIGLAVTSTAAFVIADRLYIVNITDPRNPQLISRFATFTPQAITVSGNLAFVETLLNRLQIINITDLTNPQLVSAVASSAKAMAVIGNTVFVANQYGGLQILDVTDARSPTILSTLVVDSFSVNSVTVSGQMAFVGATFGELQIIDISNLTNPKYVSSFLTGIGALNSVTISGHTAFVANQISGLQIIDITDLHHPKLLGSLSAGSSVANDVAVVGNTAFIANLNAGLQISDLTQWQFQAIAPQASDAGNYPLRIVATDVLGEKVYSPSFTVRVEGPPMFHSPISQQFAKVGQVFTYFIPQGLCTDPNQDSISYSAALVNASLPDWIKFNSVSATFTGIASSTDVGSFIVQINATDHIAGVVSTSFTLDVAHLPVVANPITPPSSLRVDRPFNMRIPVSTFKHPDSTLIYSAAKADGSRLPTWLQFDPTTLAFTGTPAAQDEGTVNLQVIATDIYGQFISAPLSLQISHNVPPEVFQPISDQSATVGQTFVFSAPVNTFTFFPGDTPFYQATLVSGADLPSWLHFDNATLTFSGSPGRVDTDPFSARSLSIGLQAFNYPFVEGSFAVATFHINVGGISYAALILSVIGPSVSVATFIFALYKKRALLLNHLESRRASYQKLAVTAIRGEVFEFLLETPAVHIHHLQVRQYKVKDRCCHCFRTSYQKLPGGLVIPHWMEYDYTSNRIRSRGPVPLDGPTERLIVQVKNEVNLITEEFQMHIEQPTTQHQQQEVDAEGLIVEIHNSISHSPQKQPKLPESIEMQELIPVNQTHVRGFEANSRTLNRTLSSPSQRTFRLIVDRSAQVTPSIQSNKESAPAAAGSWNL